MRLLGPLTISRAGRALPLPASRKVRALLAYLALAPLAVTRTQLCELLWDVPNDPRGELRWCLSKVRSIVDEPGRRRVRTREDTVELDLADCFVDAVEVARAAQAGIPTLPPERLRTLSALFNGDFLEGLDVDGSLAFNGWLTAQRRRFRACHTALLEHLVKGAPDDEAFTHLETWLQLAPFDPHVHELLLAALARRGRLRDGDDHLAATTRLFEAEGLDTGPIRDAWRSARAHGPTSAGGPAPAPPETAAASIPLEPVAGAARRASLAVMPFVDGSAADGTGGGPGDALAHDVITRLAQLRSVFVIAQGTVFALHERHIGSEEAGRMLNVDYVVSGSVRRLGRRITVTVELAETRTARIVWAEIFHRKADDTFVVLDEIGNRIVASIAGEIEMIERNRAILKPPSSLDAREAHHCGLWHIYRFSKGDNERARHFFETAVHLDPTFARAYAGLSFTHFQNAFQGWATRQPEVDRAFAAAGQSLMVDDRDPAAHWAMGRALWLRGQHDQSVVELERSIDLSPNFALGHYTLAFVHSQAGDPSAAIASSDYSRHLSPFDPLLFGMLGARAMALVRLGRFDEAADWAVKAAARPNAHPHILAIAAYSLALAGRLRDARAHATALRGKLPRYGVADFLAAFQFDPHGAALFRKGARRLGAP
jgi:DNA-binding SARP family transcriptional activator/TolB-like protein